jgi:cytochrome c oxidase subunit 3
MSEHTQEFGTTGKPHPFHLVNPSIWPLISAFAGGLFAVGVIMYAHEVKIGDVAVGMKGIYAGLTAIILCMFFWWKDVVKEAVQEKAHTSIVKIGLRYGMLLFILSEVMFFVAFFWAFFNASLFPKGGVWPPVGIETVPAFGLPFMMTMILLLSGCAVTWAHHAILIGNQKAFKQGIAAAAGLGFFFLGFQIFEYSHVTFGFTDGIFPSTFFMATGFHGFHVLIGATFLLVSYFRAKKGHFTKESHFGFEAAAWYWHFVDVVWLFLFVAVYWWGAGSGAEAVAAH